ncbi:hypothetical protein HNO88_004171 [Novosphingobium chloroacetimidivorans]|uniref:Ice-binding protein C-terminal domain-containing protein n=1 Tax=Novosphingobium chloroacetimidivorans TaxID=1428314 RepID=A0A7W7NXW9_9SPHN|nr:FxDxF family PEP-CTERM protein [Novosphingobium chloroacetimidivorans]MBB4860826.1 hypothetical protein [Novosphingobium chloroacetimidivorans]
MKNFVLSGLAAVAVCAFAPAASAATFDIDDGSGKFVTEFAEADGSYINASFKNTVTNAFSDTFTFELPVNGLGSGSLSATFLNAATLIITSVVVQSGGTSTTFLPGTGDNDIRTTATGLSLNTTGVPLFGGPNNSITVNGTAGSTPITYTGNITFEASAVPEASTWALMILGIGAVGFAARRSRKTTVRVAYA